MSKKKIAGVALATLLLAWALQAYARFLQLHPEARHGILGLAAASVAVYAFSVALIARYL